MKKILIIFGILSLTQCQSQNKKEIKMETYSETYQTLLPNLSRRIYGIGLNIPGPYELYINDIAARKDYDPGMHNAAMEINPYVLKSGIYNFRIRVFPMPSEFEKGGIQPHTAKSITITLETFEKVMEGEGAEPNTFKVLKEYPIPVITKPVPFLDIEGEFEVELPYELEGWSSGQDLSKMDSTQLKEKVVKYYEKIKDILNDGNVEEWERKEEKRREETYIFNYTFENTKKETEEKSLDNIKRFTKGNMTKIDNYQLFIYGKGQLVTLEKIDKENKGEGALRTLEPDGAVRIYNMKLYLPQGSDEFVIIRK